MVKETGQADAFGKSSKSPLECGDDFRNDIHKLVERSNARFAALRRLTTEDYLAGKAHLCWNVEFVTSGCRYELRFTAGKVESTVNDGGGFSRKLTNNNRDFCYAGGGNDKAVLVDQVEFMQFDKGIVPSWIRLEIGNDLLGNRASLPDIILEPTGQRLFGLGKREFCVANGLAVSNRAGSDEVIECGSQVVDRVTNRESDFAGNVAALRNDVAKTIVLELSFESNFVRISAKELGLQGIDLRNVDFCAANL